MLRVMNLRGFFAVDIKDVSNWVGIAIAIPLLLWGVSTIISVAKGG